jgi:hypothetical protein
MIKDLVYKPKNVLNLGLKSKKATLKSKKATFEKILSINKNNNNNNKKKGVIMNAAH